MCTLSTRKVPECRLTLIPDHNLYRNFNCSRILVPLASIDGSSREKRLTDESNFGLPEYMCKEENIKVKTDIFLAVGGAVDIETPRHKQLILNFLRGHVCGINKNNIMCNLLKI